MKRDMNEIDILPRRFLSVVAFASHTVGGFLPHRDCPEEFVWFLPNIPVWGMVRVRTSRLFPQVSCAPQADTAVVAGARQEVTPFLSQGAPSRPLYEGRAFAAHWIRSS